MVHKLNNITVRNMLFFRLKTTFLSFKADLKILNKMKKYRNRLLKNFNNIKQSLNVDHSLKTDQEQDYSRNMLNTFSKLNINQEQDYQKNIVTNLNRFSKERSEAVINLYNSAKKEKIELLNKYSKVIRSLMKTFV